MDFIENSIITHFKDTLLNPFINAIKKYELIKENDKIGVCISGGKDSMIMAKLFQIYKSISDIKFDVTYFVMNPGYNKKNLDLIKHNLKFLEIDASIIDTDIFEIANAQDKSPCYLCAKMRRGALYRIASEFSCNKIALGHHYDDVIITTLMNMLNSGSLQTMLPKLHSKNYKGMELIRPCYLIKEKDIIDFKNKHNLSFLACACKFTETVELNHLEKSQRLETKLLIERIKKDIFSSMENVYVDEVISYIEKNQKKSNI